MSRGALKSSQRISLFFLLLGKLHLGLGVQPDIDPGQVHPALPAPRITGPEVDPPEREVPALIGQDLEVDPERRVVVFDPAPLIDIDIAAGGDPPLSDGNRPVPLGHRAGPRYRRDLVPDFVFLVPERGQGGLDHGIGDGPPEGVLGPDRRKNSVELIRQTGGVGVRGKLDEAPVPPLVEIRSPVGEQRDRFGIEPEKHRGFQADQELPGVVDLLEDLAPRDPDQLVEIEDQEPVRLLARLFPDSPDKVLPVVRGEIDIPERQAVPIRRVEERRVDHLVDVVEAVAEAEQKAGALGPAEEVDDFVDFGLEGSLRRHRFPPFYQPTGPSPADGHLPIHRRCN